MRVQSFAIAVLTTVAASGAIAQHATAPSGTVFMNSKEIMGLVDKAKADALLTRYRSTLSASESVTAALV